MNRTQLADAMLKGAKTHGVIESRGHYLDADSATCMACAIGSALIGKLNGDFYEAEMEFEKAGGFDFDSDEVAIFADLLEIPRELAVVVEFKHMNGLSIEDIAKWLKGGE